MRFEVTLKKSFKKSWKPIWRWGLEAATARGAWQSRSPGSAWCSQVGLMTRIVTGRKVFDKWLNIYNGKQCIDGYLILSEKISSESFFKSVVLLVKSWLVSVFSTKQKKTVLSRKCSAISYNSLHQKFPYHLFVREMIKKMWQHKKLSVWQ